MSSGFPPPERRSPPPLAARWIAHFRMERIPQEQAWFAPAYRSDEQLPRAPGGRYAGQRDLSNSIHCVITREDFSALHRLATDELWHIYAGSPLEMLLLYPDGRGETVVLGSDVLAGQRPQFCVPRGVWQGARPVEGDEACTLLGNSMAPAFDYADFEIGYREELQRQYPAFAPMIAELTRAGHLRRPPA
ncbi:MAG TPA: cupin domain-containing protein [Lacunisphaera sp.]|nr:cupin domain-containing protein [Lacunisphaera sp.]